MVKLPSTKKKSQLRLRVFAGPNGSGKSTVIEYVRNYKTAGTPIDFGHYINADEIAVKLDTAAFSFQKFGIITNRDDFRSIALKSGLVGERFSRIRFDRCFRFGKNKIFLEVRKSKEALAQIIADFLRKKLLQEQKRFSFETVFSHPSKLDIMRQAAKEGYKVYLYFVSTESPDINKFRVLARKAKGGHDVPPATIESRYYRSLDLLYEACQLAYQVYFFDNSAEGKDSKLFAHFKAVGGVKQWDPIEAADIPQWFKLYYAGKIRKK